MANVSGEQKLQFPVTKVLVQNIAKCQLLVGNNPVAGHIAKIAHKTDQIGLAHQGKESVYVVCLFPEFGLQLADVRIKSGGYGKSRAVREVEAIHRIHLYPLSGNAQFRKESACDGRWIAKQGVEMRGRVKRVTLAPKRT